MGVQTTLDGKIAEKAMKKLAKVMMQRESEPPKLYRDPHQPYFEELREIAMQAITDWFANYHAPIPRDTLINKVYEIIKGRRLRGEWPYPIPRYDTIRRRINELIEPQIVGEPTPALAIEAEVLDRLTTLYFPNPLRVSPDKKKEVMEVLEEWKRARKKKRSRS